MCFVQADVDLDAELNPLLVGKATHGRLGDLFFEVARVRVGALLSNCPLRTPAGSLWQGRCVCAHTSCIYLGHMHVRCCPKSVRTRMFCLKESLTFDSCVGSIRHSQATLSPTPISDPQSP